MTQRALEAGAKAFILKVDAIAHLAEAVEMAGNHRFYLTPQAHDSLHLAKRTKPIQRQGPVTQNLTDREREAVQLLFTTVGSSANASHVERDRDRPPIKHGAF